MNKLVLLVEDNATDEKLAVRALARSGVANTVVVVRDGTEALDYLFATGSALPAVVLLDLQLPRIDGLEVLRRIRADERTRYLPVVVLTASNRTEDIATSYALGANAYVRKSLELAEFSEALRAMGSFWLQLNELPGAAGKV